MSVGQKRAVLNGGRCSTWPHCRCRSPDCRRLPSPRGRLVFRGGPHRRQGLGGEGPGLPLGAAVGPGDALQHPSDPLVIGGTVVSGSLVHGCQGGLVEADGGHGEVAVIDQVGQVGGDQLGRRRQKLTVCLTDNTLGVRREQ